MLRQDKEKLREYASMALDTLENASRANQTLGRDDSYAEAAHKVRMVLEGLSLPAKDQDAHVSPTATPPRPVDGLAVLRVPSPKTAKDAQALSAKLWEAVRYLKTGYQARDLIMRLDECIGVMREVSLATAEIRRYHRAQRMALAEFR